MITERDNPIVLFDGLCNLCSGAVQFILKHERNNTMRFASLQSDIGIALLKQFGIATEETDSVIFIRDSRAFIKSDAALEIAGYLKQPWSWLRSTSFIPRRVRDFFYDGIAKNRYAVFGKKEACWLPTPETKERFMTK